MALTIPYQRIGPWWQHAATTAAAWWRTARAGGRHVRAGLVRLWRWLLADPARFRAATHGLAVCLFVGAAIGWVTAALVTRTVGLAVHEVLTGP
jgi:hypothetical protein